MTKPTEYPDWDTAGTNSVEPSAGDKLSGDVASTNTTAFIRTTMNWMFKKIGEWIRFVDEDIYTKTEGDARYFRIDQDLGEGSASDIRTTLGVLTQTESDARYVNESDLSSDAETQTGTAVDKAVTPASLSSRTSTTTRTGLVEKATNTEAVNGTANKFIDATALQHALLNPSDVAAKRDALDVYSKSEMDTRYVNESDFFLATTTSAGIVEKATNTEAVNGTADKFIDSATLQHALLNPTDVKQKQQALGIYSGTVQNDATTPTFVENPASWTLSKDGARTVITHNLGTTSYRFVGTSSIDVNDTGQLMVNYYDKTANTITVAIQTKEGNDDNIEAFDFVITVGG